MEWTFIIFPCVLFLGLTVWIQIISHPCHRISRSQGQLELPLFFEDISLIIQNALSFQTDLVASPRPLISQHFSLDDFFRLLTFSFSTDSVETGS